MTVGDFRENGKFEKTGNWERIHQIFGKTSIEVTKREILTNGGYNKKMANFGRTKKISAKMASGPKIHHEFRQIFKGDDKKGHLDKWRFHENYKFGKNLFKVWQI